MANYVCMKQRNNTDHKHTRERDYTVEDRSQPSEINYESMESLNIGPRHRIHTFEEVPASLNLLKAGQQ